MTDAASEVLALAERAAVAEGAERQELEAQLNAQADHVLAAVRHSLDADPEAALRLTGALVPFWEDTGQVDDGRQLTEAALERAPDGPSIPRGRAVLALAELAFRQGDQDVAQRLCREAIEIGRLTGDERTEAFAHLNLARVAFRDEDGSLMESHAQDALAAARLIPAVRRGAVHMLAWAAYVDGDRDTAKARFEESLALRQAIGDSFGVATEEGNLADLAAEEGDPVGAAARLESVLATAQELSSSYLVVNFLPSVAALAARAGLDEDAARLAGATDAIAETSGLIPDPGNWQPVMDEANARLGARAEKLRSEGATLDQGRAVQLALQVAAAIQKTRVHDA